MSRAEEYRIGRIAHHPFGDKAMPSSWNVVPAAGLLLALAGLGTGACEAPPRPVLGVTSSGPYVDAARIAIMDATVAGALPVDTMLRPEASNSAQPALRTAEEFVNRPGMAAVVGHSNSAASLAASQLYNAQQIVQIAPTASAVLYSEAGPFSFRLVPPDDRQGRFLARVLRDSLPPGASVALLYVNDDYGRGLRSAVLEGMAELGDPQRIAADMPHTERLPVDPEMKDHQLGALTASEADVILWLGRASTLHEVLPAIRRAAGDIPIYGGDAVGPGQQIRTHDGRWHGVRHVAFAELNATAEGRRFATRYEERFGVPAGAADALTYDAVALVLSAVGSGARTGPQIRDYLLSLGRERAPYGGVTGPIQFDENGDVERSYHLATVAEAPVP